MVIKKLSFSLRYYYYFYTMGAFFLLLVNYFLCPARICVDSSSFCAVTLLIRLKSQQCLTWGTIAQSKTLTAIDWRDTRNDLIPKNDKNLCVRIHWQWHYRLYFIRQLLFLCVSHSLSRDKRFKHKHRI